MYHTIVLGHFDILDQILAFLDVQGVGDSAEIDAAAVAAYLATDAAGA